MKKENTLSFKVLFFLTAILLLFSFNASNTFAEFYVIAGSKRVGTEIKSLPYTISSPGFYYITKDLTCLTSTHGITINADNVTLDLMGFSLTYNGGVGDHDGIYMNGRSNVEIRNGTIQFFVRHGINQDEPDEGGGNRIINIRAINNSQNGIYLLNRGHLVKGCTAANNKSYGISASIGSTVSGNTCYDNTNYGISAGYGATVTGNTCYSNGNGIIVGIATTVIGNTCYDNSYCGISLLGRNLVDQNIAYSNPTYEIQYCSNCEFGTNIG